MKRARGALLGAAIVAVTAASACGGSTSVPAAGVAAAVATAVPAAAAVATGVPAATASRDAVLARGKEIFQKTAGGVGCAYCHGPEAKGGASGTTAPNIRGGVATEAKLRAALAGGAPLMSFIKLDDEEIEAVLRYVQSLDQQ